MVERYNNLSDEYHVFIKRYGGRAENQRERTISKKNSLGLGLGLGLGRGRAARAKAASQPFGLSTSKLLPTRLTLKYDMLSFSVSSRIAIKGIFYK